MSFMARGSISREKFWCKANLRHVSMKPTRCHRWSTPGQHAPITNLSMRLVYYAPHTLPTMSVIGSTYFVCWNASSSRYYWWRKNSFSGNSPLKMSANLAAWRSKVSPVKYILHCYIIAFYSSYFDKYGNSHLHWPQRIRQYLTFSVSLFSRQTWLSQSSPFSYRYELCQSVDDLHARA